MAPIRVSRTIWTKITALATLWTVTEFLLHSVSFLAIDPTRKSQVNVGCYVIVILISILMLGQTAIAALSRGLKAVAHWLVLISLLLSGWTLWMVWSLRTSPPRVTLLNIRVPFDLSHGRIFNSWQNPDSGHARHIVAWGAGNDRAFLNIASDNTDTASFSYVTDPNIAPSNGASSGAYETFYDKPGDRRIFHKLVFSVQSDETCGTGRADVGLRLTMDDPTDKDKREYFTYELTSLRGAGRIVDGKMRQVEVPISELTRLNRVLSVGPLPSGLDENTINKVVFFVNNSIANQCPRNTLRFRSVSLEP